MTYQTLPVETLKRLITLDETFYRDSNQDLAGFDDPQLIEHYCKFGYHEGRAAHVKSLRENFFDIPPDMTCLEVGPFFRPIIRGENVKYIDVLSREEMADRAAALSASKEQIENIPFIDFVSRDGSLKGIEETFEVIISSHSLEHQPDLIEHLNQVSVILAQNGSYKMAVPNCAYCFDAHLPPSKISEIISANRNKDRVHSIAKVIEHRALTTHNDPHQHWDASFMGNPEYVPIEASRVEAAIQEFDAANGAYIDVHSWQFQPHTLADILRALIDMGMIPFTDLACYGPVRGRNEFCIELIK